VVDRGYKHDGWSMVLPAVIMLCVLLTTVGLLSKQVAAIVIFTTMIIVIGRCVVLDVITAARNRRNGK